MDVIPLIPTQNGRTEKYISVPCKWVILKAVNPEIAITTPFGFTHWNKQACINVNGFSILLLSVDVLVVAILYAI